jgi:hypothetical protein
MPTAEHARLRDDGASWKRWGPYVAERAWGTVREDYSANGDAWRYFPHDHARSRAYRWSEDGIAGICDTQQRLCFALVCWNGRDSILKERLFGLSGPEGNHGEDVKECYYYLDSTPTHSSMLMLYKYPQRAFPYEELVRANAAAGRGAPEYELIDTGIFAEDRYFDIFVEYAKAAPDDILIRIRAVNRGPEAAELHLLPTLWFRNIWNWGGDYEGAPELPELHAGPNHSVIAVHPTLGRYRLACDGAPVLLFTENETDAALLFGGDNRTPYVKNAFHRFVVNGEADAVNPEQRGTKAAAHYRAMIAPGGVATLRLRLSDIRAVAHTDDTEPQPFADFETIFAARAAEADAYYTAIQPAALSDDDRRIQRQALAGMLWSKQVYIYDVDRWLRGDAGQPPPPAERRHGRNREWEHFNTVHVLSMPDKWEYPWFAAWDLAFHCLPLAMLDPEFAKDQLIMLGREWYQHPNGQTPAYEWNFSDVNPPVLAWAAWHVYQIERRQLGADVGDLVFLERVFHKLLLNFTWWVNRKDAEGNNVFQGGFLGLDNIGVFDRSAPLPFGGHIEQSDGTSWMGMFCLNMLTIALELACHNRAYEDIAVKFFEHFLYIADAMNNIAGEGIALWDAEDEFFYDVLHLGPHQNIRLRVRSMVGLIPLFAVATIEPWQMQRLPEFRGHLEWFLNNRPHLAALVSRWHEPGRGERRLLAICRGHRMKRLLRRMLDPQEFLAPHGVRALSRYHADHPYTLNIDGASYRVAYLPGDSDSGLFGGNSNWRGPIWFPVNYLIIEALHHFHNYYSDDFVVECPTGSGQFLTLEQIADELSRRLIGLFRRDAEGRRAVFGDEDVLQNDPHWRDYVLFYEYFHGDTGRGLGAGHQTGWTGLVATMIQHLGEKAADAES